MSTCVFYVDESGDPRKYDIPLRQGQTAIFSLTAIGFPLSDWRELDREYLGLKTKFFAKEIARVKVRAEIWEVKGRDLTAPRNKGDRRNEAFIRSVIKLCNRFGAKAFAVTFKKNHLHPALGESLYTNALQILVERFSTFIAESSAFDKGIIIADSRIKGLDRNVALSHMSFIFGHATGKQFTNIMEAPLFADSRLTVGLQLSDIISSLIFGNHYNYHSRSVSGAPDYSHLEKYWDLTDGLQFKSKKKYDGYIMYGYRFIDQSKQF